MNKFPVKVSAMILTFFIISTNLVSVASAETDTTPPSVGDITAKAQETAAYVLSQTSFEAEESPNIYSFNGSSGFYTASRNLILAINSGLDCSEYSEKYLDSVKKMLDSDGQLLISGSSYDNVSNYAYLIEVLYLTGNNPEDFEGTDIVSAFSKAFNTNPAANVSYINPYKLGVVYQVIKAYSDTFEKSDEAIETIVNCLDTLSNDNGYDSYGYSADNNSIFVTFYTLNNSDTKESLMLSKIANIVEYTYNTFYMPDTGLSFYPSYLSNPVTYEPIKDDTGNYTIIGNYISSDSTALSLALYAQYNKPDIAAASYNALLVNYSSSSTPGLFDENSFDPLYATQDALIGLVTYKCVLENAANPFDIANIVIPGKVGDDADNSSSNDDNGNFSGNTGDDADNSSGNDDNGNFSGNTGDDADNGLVSTENLSAVNTADYSNPILYFILLAASGFIITGSTIKYVRIR